MDADRGGRLPGPRWILASHAGTSAPFPVPVPKDLALVGRFVHAQGLCTGAPGPQLGNALDVIVGR